MPSDLQRKDHQDQPLARRNTTSIRPILASVPPVPRPIRRQLPIVIRGLLTLCLIGALVVCGLGSLLLAGQDELIARIIVGAVLVVVFGTPLLCIASLFVFSFWAMTRFGRRAVRQSSSGTSTPKTPPDRGGTQ